MGTSACGDCRFAGEFDSMTKPLRVAAWLITPLVVWVGAFSGGWLGALLGGSLTWLVVGGVLGGLAAVCAWSLSVLRLKKRSAMPTEEDRT